MLSYNLKLFEKVVFQKKKLQKNFLEKILGKNLQLFIKQLVNYLAIKKNVYIFAPKK